MAIIMERRLLLYTGGGGAAAPSLSAGLTIRDHQTRGGRVKMEWPPAAAAARIHLDWAAPPAVAAAAGATTAAEPRGEVTMTATEAAEATTLLPLSVGKLRGWERGGGLEAQTAPPTPHPQLIDSVRRLKPRKNTLGHGRRAADVFEEDFFFGADRSTPLLPNPT